MFIILSGSRSCDWTTLSASGTFLSLESARLISSCPLHSHPPPTRSWVLSTSFHAKVSGQIPHRVSNPSGKPFKYKKHMGKPRIGDWRVGWGVQKAAPQLVAECSPLAVEAIINGRLRPQHTFALAKAAGEVFFLGHLIARKLRVMFILFPLIWFCGTPFWVGP